MKKVAFSLLFLILIASNCWSADGPYIGAGATLTRLEVDDFNDVENGYKLFGGWRLSENFAIEGSWQDPGEFKENDVKLDIDGYTAEVLGITPDLDGIKFFGKIGYYDFSADNKVSGEDTKEDGMLLGVGLMGELEKNLAVRVEFNWFDSDDLAISGALTIEWYFIGPN